LVRQARRQTGYDMLPSSFSIFGTLPNPYNRRMAVRNDDILGLALPASMPLRAGQMIE